MVTLRNLAQGFFTADEQQRITRTVHQVEQQTTGEIVPMVVATSHAYPEAEVIGAAFLALPAALMAAYAISFYFWWSGEVVWLFLACFFPLFVLARLLMRFPCLFRLFLSSRRIDEEVERSAREHFYAQGLQATREGTGILIYISVLERKVWILGDRGINERLAPQIWQGFVADLVVGMREKKQCDALCRVMEGIGAVLHEHFPSRTDDANELGDVLIIPDPGSTPPKRALVVR